MLGLISLLMELNIFYYCFNPPYFNNLANKVTLIFIFSFYIHYIFFSFVFLKGIFFKITIIIIAARMSLIYDSIRIDVSIAN